jgi:hypothetical protein
MSRIMAANPGALGPARLVQEKRRSGDVGGTSAFGLGTA